MESVEQRDRDYDRIEETVRRTIAYAAGLAFPSVTLQSRMEDLGLDSVAMTALRVVLEAEFELLIDDDEASSLMTADTVSAAVAIVVRAVHRNRA